MSTMERASAGTLANWEGPALVDGEDNKLGRSASGVPPSIAIQYQVHLKAHGTSLLEVSAPSRFSYGNIPNDVGANIPLDLQRELVKVITSTISTMKASDFDVQKHTSIDGVPGGCGPWGKYFTHYTKASEIASEATRRHLSMHLSKVLEYHTSVSDDMPMDQGTHGWELPTPIKDMILRFSTGPHYFNDIRGTNSQADKSTNTVISTDHECTVKLTSMGLEVTRDGLTGKASISCSPEVQLCGHEKVWRALTGSGLEAVKCKAEDILSAFPQADVDYIQQWTELPSKDTARDVTKEMQKHAQYPKCTSLWDNPVSGPRIMLSIPRLDMITASPKTRVSPKPGDNFPNHESREQSEKIHEEFSTQILAGLQQRRPLHVDGWTWAEVTSEVCQRGTDMAHTQQWILHRHPESNPSKKFIPLKASVKPHLVDCSHLETNPDKIPFDQIFDGWGVNLPEVEPEHATHIYVPFTLTHKDDPNKVYWKTKTGLGDFTKIPQDGHSAGD